MSGPNFPRGTTNGNARERSPEGHVSGPNFPRGTTNGNARGSSRDRARRRAWLLETFGDGKTCPCAICGVALDETTITVDRIVPGKNGGKYIRSNIRPACISCNSSTGSKLASRPRRVA